MDKKKISLYEASNQFLNKHCKTGKISGIHCKKCIHYSGGECVHPEWLKLKLQIKCSRK
jgi:hypothetical protein